MIQNKQKFIEQLTKETSTYNYKSQAENQANSLEIISSDIYSQRERFIYELIQNADDSCENSQQGIDILIQFTHNYLIISHTGKPFSENDIRSICGVGKSQKSHEPNKTGYKGIGFKSVFGISDYVCIFSNGYCFKFDKNYWIKENRDQKMPWQTIPLWTSLTEINELNKIDFPEKYKVTTAIKIQSDKIQDLKKDLRNLLEQTEIMLFLRDVNLIIFQDKNNEFFKIYRNKIKDQIVIKVNDRLDSQWIKNDFKISIDESIKQKLKQDKFCSEKLKEVKNINISFAVKIENDKIIPFQDGALIFTYLPTKISFNLPFIVNGDFLTNAPREAFHEDSIWNQYLFKQLGLKLLEWLAQLAKHPKYKYQITKLIPNNLSSNRDECKKSFYEGITQGKNQIAFIPNKNNDQLLKVSESLIDQTNISNIIEEDVLINYYQQCKDSKKRKKNLVDPNIEFLNKLVMFGVEKFTLDDILSLFKYPNFINKLNSYDNNWKLIIFIYKQCHESKQKDKWAEIVVNLPFILNQNNELNSPKTPLYFPQGNKTVHHLFKDDSYFNFIHEKIWKRIIRHNNIKKWLSQELKITFPSDKDFIEKTILPNINTYTYGEDEKSIQIVQYLFDAYKKKQLILNEENLKLIQNIYLLTKDNELKQLSTSFIYLSDIYNPDFSLEKYLSKDKFISEKYLRQDDCKISWNKFFIDIGLFEYLYFFDDNVDVDVNLNSIDNTKFKSIKDTYFSSYVMETYKKIRNPHIRNRLNRLNRGSTTFKLENVITVSFIESTTNNYEFAKRFWSFCLEFKDEWFNKKTKLNRKEIDNCIEYYFQCLPCIPTTKGECFKLEEVIINTEEFIKIGGKELPILDIEIEIDSNIKELFKDKLKEVINVDEYLYVLTEISKYNLEEENMNLLFERIELIYKALTNFKEKDDLEKIKKWAETNKIMAKDNCFYSPNKLFFLDTKILEIPNDPDKFVKLTKNDSEIIDSEIINLLRLWQVNVITNQDLVCDFTSPQLEDYVDVKVKERLENYIPLIALVSSKKLEQDYQEELELLKDIIKNTNFYQVKTLIIKYKQNEEEIFKQKINAFLKLDLSRTDNKDENKKHNLYFSDNWHSPRTLYQFIQELNRLLIDECTNNIEHKNINIEKELITLLLDTIDNGKEWLKEQGYEINLIKESKSLINTNISIDLYPDSPIRRTKSQEEQDKKTGRKGEQFFYDSVLDLVKERYEIQITEKGFEFRIVNRHQKVEVIWENKNEESKSPYDFQIIKEFKGGCQNIYIDVKTTRTKENQSETIPFYISPNEWNFIKQNNNKYYIARIFWDDKKTYIGGIFKAVDLEELFYSQIEEII